ncbi:hypothetical protein CCAX7_61710 [Capsulimonas corticalis]|uniref:JAB domain-containing protein n=1 Tax=Capsulimonas corticalis TaxID=2219043 RepID=A0A402CWE4_9BACT|nr:Mov34/MPN/PAD-1 family protein [Capsulimonas corticalis]BDI34120.1 hypothetical protein CCAX7_61710 [Capsulimonas corticalis]
MPISAWSHLVSELAARGDGVRESGAFLLGQTVKGRREAVRFAFYDDLEPGCLEAGYIIFTSVGYRKLWKILKESGLQVVADVHTHPGPPFQSPLDRDNPMMASSGHLAFIVPNYAQGRPQPADVAYYTFLGNHQWSEVKPGPSAQKLYVGRWS